MVDVRDRKAQDMSEPRPKYLFASVVRGDGQEVSLPVINPRQLAPGEPLQAIEVEIRHIMQTVLNEYSCLNGKTMSVDDLDELSELGDRIESNPCNLQIPDSK